MKLDTTQQTSFAPYALDSLPDGFRYPERYLALSKGLEFPTGLIWWFVDAEKNSGQRAWENRQYWASEDWLLIGEIDPIPFARNGDLAAYFDGNDHSGDPKIVVLDLGNKEGSHWFENFAVWLDRAVEESGLK